MADGGTHYGKNIKTVSGDRGGGYNFKLCAHERSL